MIRSNPEQVISALKEVESRDQREWVSQAGDCQEFAYATPPLRHRASPRVGGGAAIVTSSSSATKASSPRFV